jgi:hypothetical protein
LGLKAAEPENGTELSELINKSGVFDRRIKFTILFERINKK